MKRKLLALVTLMLCAVTGAWATEETVSLVSYTVSDNTATLTSTSGDLTITLSRPGGTLPGPANNSRGLRWQNKAIISATVASGMKINSVKITSNSNGNSVTSIEYTVTDGTAALSGTWDNTPNSGKKTDYTWTASSGTYYSSWSLANIGSSGDLYISAVTVDYETATATNTAPTIVTQPSAEVEAYVGFKASLSVAATGYPAPSYQWYANTTASNVGGTAIDGATNATYTFTPAETGTYYYYAVATNNYDNQDHTVTSNVATVTVINQYSVTFAAGNSGATVALPPAEAFYPGGTNIKLPTNHYFYLDGSSVTKWSDGENEYNLGANYTVNGDVTFYPVFAENTETLGNKATSITWTFSRDEGAPSYAIEGAGKTTTVIGTTGGGMDLAMEVSLDVNPEVSTEYGKFNNTGYTNRAQVNKYTFFTIPAVQGMTVTYVGTSGTAAVTDAVTFGGEQATSVDGSSYTYEYTGEDATLTIADLQSGRYPSGVTVDYPSGSVVYTYTEANEKVLLTKVNINDNDYLTVNPTDKWATNKEYGGYSGDFFNMSNNRTLTIKVTGANSFEVFVVGAVGRGYSVQVGTEDATTITKTIGGAESSGVFEIADPTAVTTITLKGTGESVYPVYFLFNPQKEYTTTANMAGWKSFYDKDYGYELDDNTKAYVATLVEQDTTDPTSVAYEVVLDEIEAVPAGVAVLLKTTNQVTESTDGHYLMTLTKNEYVDVPEMANWLKPSVEATNTAVYRLGYNATSGVAFFPFTITNETDDDVVVLDWNADTSNGARQLTIRFADDSQTTAITQIDNGQLTIDNYYYDLQGRRVAQPGKGLYIVNGKKVIIK